MKVKEFSGNGSKTPRGSLKSLRDSPPVLTTVAVTLRPPDPSGLRSEVEVPTIKLGRAETEEIEEARATQATRGALRKEKSMNGVLRQLGRRLQW